MDWRHTEVLDAETEVCGMPSMAARPPAIRTPEWWTAGSSLIMG
ncbi:hypothetical protein [Bacilliculturomica massiliensis]|nr:hypothetical protein [Bacilliculturomica massiliensis]